jgi:hypothetical protein
MKIIFCLIIMGVSLNSYCQSTFDVFNYTEPKDWNKEIKSGMVSYTTIDNTKGSYCIISLYASTIGKESLQASFNSEWKELVASKLDVTAIPQCAKAEKLNEWESIAGSALFEYSGGKSAAMLITYTNSGKAASLLVVYNDQGYQAEIESFITRLSLSNPKSTAGNANTMQPQLTQQQFSGTGSLSDYVFTAPPGFAIESKSNEIVLRDASVPMIISILPMQPSSGNLETDMKMLFFAVFKGWHNFRHWSSGDSSTFKGTTLNGYNYILEYRDIQQNDNSESLLSAAVLLVQVNNQVAVIAGSYKQKSAALESNLVARLKDPYIYLLHSLSFKNYTPNPVPISIIGSWAARSSSTGSYYEFRSDGTFSWGGASSFKTSYNDMYDKVTTTTRANDGTWTLEGNELTTYINSTKKTIKGKLRIFYEQNYDGTWTKKLGWLSFYDEGGYGEVYYYPDNN